MDQIGAKREKICSGKGFFIQYNSVMTFIFDLENWFNVNSHCILKSYVYVKYEPNRAERS